MDWQQGYSSAGPQIDVEAIGEAREAAPGSVHAVQPGSPVAACGAAVQRSSVRPWPPSADESCPRCLTVTATYGA